MAIKAILVQPTVSNKFIVDLGIKWVNANTGDLVAMYDKVESYEDDNDLWTLCRIVGDVFSSLVQVQIVTPDDIGTARYSQERGATPALEAFILSVAADHSAHGVSYVGLDRARYFRMPKKAEWSADKIKQAADRLVDLDKLDRVHGYYFPKA